MLFHQHLVEELQYSDQLAADRPFPFSNHRIATLHGIELEEEVHGFLVQDFGIAAGRPVGERGSEGGGVGFDGGEAFQVAQGLGPAHEEETEAGLDGPRRRISKRRTRG